MRKKVKNKKISISLSFDPKTLIMIDEKHINRSKFIENCVIIELCKNKEFKIELKNKNIIL